MAKEKPKVIQHTWYQDRKGRVWVILNVLPFGADEHTEIMMLEMGKSEFINRPYAEIIEYIENETMMQICSP